jgi:hypothetical protein
VVEDDECQIQKQWLWNCIPQLMATGKDDLVELGHCLAEHRRGVPLEDALGIGRPSTPRSRERALAVEERNLLIDEMRSLFTTTNKAATKIATLGERYSQKVTPVDAELYNMGVPRGRADQMRAILEKLIDCARRGAPWPLCKRQIPNVLHRAR